ncbi:MAG TPA: S8 family serine peptidase, partial [Candidatus Thermoplasmatota archaeon]|nr:S8 family serine peptidase [Candidatus Thermoplasmatota archaeon]
SMAAPHVAAAAALLLSKDPTLTPFEVKDLLIGTARDRGTPGPDPHYGYGFLDVQAALTTLLEEKATESTQAVEVQRPFRATGSFGAVANQVVLSGGNPQMPPNGILKVPLDVAPGAQAVSFTFEWSAPGATFEVHLVDSAGKARYGPFVPQGSGRISATVENLPEGRAWHLEARPKGVVTHGTFDLEGEATLIELHTVDAKPAGGYAAKAKQGIHNPAAVGFFEEQARMEALREAFSGENLLKLGALIGALAAVAVALIQRKRKQ